MPSRTFAATAALGATALRLAPIALAAGLLVTTAACSNTFVQHRTQGYVLSESALQQVRPGQSRDLVTTVLGSPMTESTFGGETAWYYVETKVSQTQFGLTTVQERTVLAVYFDGNNRVSDTAVYGLEDGRSFTIQGRRTPSFGQDRTFIEQLLQSI